MKNNAPEWATHVATHNNDGRIEYATKMIGGHYDSQGLRFNSPSWTFEPIEKTESVYTQEMKDNGERVKVGMKFKASGSIFTAGLVSDSVVACVQDDEMFAVSFEHIEPIVSEREEAEAKQIEDCFSEYTKGKGEISIVYSMNVMTNLKRLQKAGLLAEIILPLKRS